MPIIPPPSAKARGPARAALTVTWLALSTSAWAQPPPAPPAPGRSLEAAVPAPVGTPPPPPPPPPAPPPPPVGRSLEEAVPPPADAPQAPAPPPPAGPPSQAPTVNVSADGLVIVSPDKQFQLKVGGHIQADGRLFTEGKEKAGGNGFLIRRARPVLESTFFGFADFRLMPDFAGGTAVLFDAYLDLHPLRELRLRVGKFKHPVGLERLQTDTALVFMERSLATNLVPSRDVGAQLHGEALGGVLTYAFGVFNGAADTSNADVNLEDNVDLAGRLYVQPFRRTPLTPLKGLGIGLAASRGSEHGTVASSGEVGLRTTGQQVFFSYLTGTTAADTVVADGHRLRWAPNLYYSWGPFGLLAEYISSTQQVRRAADRASLTNTGWQLTASYVLLGGNASFDGVRPTRPINPAEGSWGAVELAARYSTLHIDPATFPLFADPDRSARTASAGGLALNWYLTSNTRLGVNLERTTFEGGAAGGADRATEFILFERLQVFW